MVCVRRAQATHDPDPDVRHVITVGVFEKQQVRDGGHEHASVPELEAGGVLDVCKGDGAVGDAVAVVVRQNEESVVHLTGRLPLRVGAPRRGPQTASGVDAELHGIHELRKHLLGGEDVGTEAGLQAHLVDALLGGQEVEGA